MCDDFISIDLKNFRLGYQLIMFGSHPNRDHLPTIEKKLFLKIRDTY